MENRVAIELSGEGCDTVTDEELRALALLDYELGLTLKRQHRVAGRVDGRVVLLVEYHLENVAHTSIAQLGGRTLRDGTVRVSARHTTSDESTQLLASSFNDTRTEFCGRFVPRDTAKLRRQVQLMGGQVEVELRMTTEGGTGGKLWDATPILAEWALRHRDLWSGRVVHELGAGLGLPGLAIAVSADPSRVVLSDCVQECLATMQQNAVLNAVQDKVAVHRFDWRDAVQQPESVPQALYADVVICSDVIYSREVAGWLPQAALACLRPGGSLFALLPISRMGCRECLHELGKILVPFEPPGADPAVDTEMAEWIKKHLGPNQLGHRIYGFRAPSAEGVSGPDVTTLQEPSTDTQLDSWSITWEIMMRKTKSSDENAVIVAQLRLPLLNSVAGADLRATGRKLSFEAPPESEYETAIIELPTYVDVDADRWSATFSKRSRTLRVRLPLLKCTAGEPRVRHQTAE